ncbi:hypothetical protein LINPERHAP2_LOCUS34652, partial [Linum perenne]
VRTVFRFVILLNPSLPPGSQTCAGWSKLCHNGSTEPDPFSRTRFPSSRTAASTEAVVLDKLVDQTGRPDSLKRTRLPSEILRWEENLLEIGASLLATQTMVCKGI